MKALLMLTGLLACIVYTAVNAERITPTCGLVITVMVVMWCGVVNVGVDLWKEGVRR